MLTSDIFCHNVVVEVVGIKAHISCQHLEFSRKDYQLRCTLAIVTFGKGIATVD